MDLEQVRKAEEKYSGEIGFYNEEHKQYAVFNIEQFGEECSVLYEFKEDKLGSVFFTPVSNTYRVAATIVEQLYITYGVPSEIKRETEEVVPRSILTWHKDEYQIELTYSYDNDYISNSLWISFKPYDGKDDCLPYKERICPTGAKAIPCTNTSLVWSEYCYKHGCFVFGCNEYVYTNDKGYGVCTRHRDMY